MAVWREAGKRLDFFATDANGPRQEYRAAAIVLRSSRESIIEGQHNLRAGEAGAV